MCLVCITIYLSFQPPDPVMLTQERLIELTNLPCMAQIVKPEILLANLFKWRILRLVRINP